MPNVLSKAVGSNVSAAAPSSKTVNRKDVSLLVAALPR
jgi:hypothetical protein